jgi:hypothetical protein
MVEFAHILVHVEGDSQAFRERAMRPGVDVPLSTIERSETAAPPYLAGARARLANDIYSRSRPPSPDLCGVEPDSSHRARAMDKHYASLRARLKDPRLSLQELSALRREFAWRLHPDRHVIDAKPDENLADLNALIDSLIESRRSRCADR